MTTILRITGLLLVVVVLSVALSDLSLSQQSMSYEQWVSGLQICYDRRPRNNDLAERLIAKYPDHSKQLFILMTVAIFSRNEDLKKFGKWYLDIVKNSVENAALQNLYEQAR